MSTTAISRRVAQIEEQLGARLLNRTTRRLSLTPAGSVALERAEQLLADLEELREVVAGDGTPRGHVRVTAGVSWGHSLLHEGLPTFVEAYPNVSVEIILTDRRVDLVAESIDLAVRIGQLADSSLVARRLGSVGHLICATPRWLAEHGPVTAETLQALPRIVDTNQPLTWQLTGPDHQHLEIEASGRYAVNNAHATLAACQAGLGVAMLPDFVARPALADGVITNALPGWKGPDVGLFAIVLQRRWASATVRALMHHIARLIANEPGI